MEPITLLIIIGGALVLIALALMMKRFFFRMLKHIIIASALGALLMAGWYYFFLRSPHDPNIGKQAYTVGTDQYLGEVVGSAKDAALGEIWIVQRPNGYPTKYRKSRVVLKDK
jgi:hypothetical protein